MQKSKTINKKGIIEELKKEESKCVVLFDNNLQLKRFTEHIGQEARQDILISAEISHARPFRVLNNMVQFGTAKVFLGLKKDETYLIGPYPESSVKYYEE